MNTVDSNMTDQDYMLLSQYLDGELPAEDAHVLRQRLLAEPDLRARFDHMRKIDTQMKIAAAEAAHQVPASITGLLEAEPRQDRHPSGYRGLAIAASLLAATAVLMVPDWRATQEADLDVQLATVLETAPSSAETWSALADGRQVQPVLSFRNASGQWCREYLVVAQDKTQRGVACRSEAAAQWSTEVLADSAPAASHDDYIAASGTDSSGTTVADYIAEHAADIPLGRSAESALIRNRWQ